MAYVGSTTKMVTLSRQLGADGLRILIIEDNADCAESMAGLLRLYGHEVEIAADGRSGLASAQAFEPDVVLLDLGLPEISGYDVALQLARPRPALTPMIIAVTGYGSDRERRRSAESGIHLHLVKPVDSGHLQAVLKRFQRMLNSVTAA